MIQSQYIRMQISTSDHFTFKLFSDHFLIIFWLLFDQIISANTIIAFTEDMDAIMFVLTVLSSVLQLYVIYAAVKHIQRKTSDKVSFSAEKRKFLA